LKRKTIFKFLWEKGDMDSSLLKQREAFLKRASAVPTVFNRQDRYSSATNTSEKHNSTSAKNAAVLSAVKKPKMAKSVVDYKNAKACMATNFGILAKVLEHMKKRFLENLNWSLSLEEIFEELQMFGVSGKITMWLKEILPGHPRMNVDEDGKFTYKPPYKVKGKNSLLALLKRREIDGAGALLLSELYDCVLHPDKLVQALGNQVLALNVSLNKRKDVALFYNESEPFHLSVDEDLKMMWRNISVSQYDDEKLEEYVRKQGLDTLLGLKHRDGPGKAHIPKRKPRKKPVVLQNEHLSKTGLLESYD
ncbi:General transcription factor IIE subunit 2, partial [Trichinella pseudospiralis]